MQFDQALSIARSRLVRAASFDNTLYGNSPAAVETREVLASLETLQGGLASGAIDYVEGESF